MVDNKIPTGRERLLELVCKGLDTECGSECYLPSKQYCKECCGVTDYLLDKGVLVPPCKVGDTVWIVDENSNEFDGIDECKISRIIWDGTSFLLMFDKDNFGYYDYSIGKKVFLSREDAVKERDKNESI